MGRGGGGFRTALIKLFRSTTAIPLEQLHFSVSSLLLPYRLFDLFYRPACPSYLSSCLSHLLPVLFFLFLKLCFVFNQSFLSCLIFCHSITTATISKQRRNEASILTSFSISKRNEPAYSSTCKDRSEANPAYSTP